MSIRSLNVVNKPVILIDKKKIGHFCKKNHISSLAVFGSALTSQFGPSSDVDILVKFELRHTPSLFDIVDMESELSAIVGRHVDLKTAKDLSPYFRDDVIKKAKIIYG
jgi:hypothetical protein